MSVLYHGSTAAHLEILKPRAHSVVHGKAVVFAATDPLLAMAMILGTGEELAVGYIEDGSTGDKQLYIDELQPGKLELLKAVGYLYEVSAMGFESAPKLMQEERISRQATAVVSAQTLPNVRVCLQQQGVVLTPYADVPKSMAQRGQRLKQPGIPHPADRLGRLLS